MRGKWSQFPVSEPEKHRKTKSSGTSPPVWHNQSWESHEGDLISLRMFLSPSSLISPHGVLQLIKSRPREIFKPHSNTSAIRDDYRKRKIMTLGLLHIEISSWWFCFSSRSSIRSQEVKTRWIHEKTTCWKWDGNVFSALQRSDVFWFLRFLVSDASRTLWFLVIPKKSTQQLIQTVLTGSDKVFQSVSLHFMSTIGAQTVASQPRMKTILRFFPHIFQISWISTQLLNASDENAPIKTENVMSLCVRMTQRWFRICSHSRPDALLFLLYLLEVFQTRDVSFKSDTNRFTSSSEIFRSVEWNLVEPRRFPLFPSLLLPAHIFTLPSFLFGSIHL